MAAQTKICMTREPSYVSNWLAQIDISKCAMASTLCLADRLGCRALHEIQFQDFSSCVKADDCIVGGRKKVTYRVSSVAKKSGWIVFPKEKYHFRLEEAKSEGII
jgi:hypothetical protein